MSKGILSDWFDRMPRWQSALIAVPSSAVLFYFGTGLQPIWPLAWFAPLPVLFFAFRSTWWWAGLVSLVAFAAGRWFLVGYGAHMANGVTAAGVSLWVLSGVIPALVFAVCILLARLIALRVTPSLAVFAFPTAWAIYEAAAATNRYTGALFATVNSQTDFLPLLQSASIVGAPGVAFLVMLFAGAMAMPWEGKARWQAAPCAVVIIAALLFGTVRLSMSGGEPPVRIGLIGSATKYKATATQTPEDALAISASYMPAVRDLASQGARAILLPEKIIGLAADTEQVVNETWISLAKSSNVALIVGEAVHTKPAKNLAIAIATDGAVTTYQKHHLVPGIENEFAPGKELGLLGSLGAGWAFAICKDMDFPAWLRRYGQNDTRLVFAPALDFDVDARLHSRSAVVRSVENGFALARVANRGQLTLSDAYGRIVAEKSAAEGPLVTVIGELRPGPGRTVFARFGNWFVLLCVAVLIATAIAATKRRARGT